MYRKLEIQLAGRPLSLETGRLAKQAHGAVLAQYGETVVLATVVSAYQSRDKIDFLPLTVDYQEKTFAAGKIPGGFFKREGRPSRKGNPDLAPDRSRDASTVSQRLRQGNPDHRQRPFGRPRKRLRYARADCGLGRARSLRYPPRRSGGCRADGPDRRQAGGQSDCSATWSRATFRWSSRPSPTRS